jgi:cytochrome P450
MHTCTPYKNQQIVRAALNELSYIHESAWKDIYSSHRETGQHKKHLVPLPDGRYGVFSNPSDEEHARFRKQMSPAFSDKSIREKDSIIQSYISLLIRRLKSLPKGESVDLLHWLGCAAVDITGYLTFGESFQSL